MNVLLAEANVPYTQLAEMDEINPEFPQTDVALVIGANDVTNPAARSDPASPIYGMPILDVDKAASVVVLKRSMNPGFAGIDNELYLDPKTTMLFGDAKESVVKLIRRGQVAVSVPVFGSARREPGGRARTTRTRRCARRSSRTPAANGRCRRRSTSRTTRPGTSARCRRSAAATRCSSGSRRSRGIPRAGCPTVTGPRRALRRRRRAPARRARRGAVTALRTGAAAVLAAETLGRGRHVRRRRLRRQRRRLRADVRRARRASCSSGTSTRRGAPPSPSGSARAPPRARGGARVPTSSSP